jgi:heme/copper-type cytochrome/quinol oxidase subunit 2
MKNDVKVRFISGITFVFLAGFCFGYGIARQIWEGFYLYTFIVGVICVLVAIYFFRMAIKKRNEENRSLK